MIKTKMTHAELVAYALVPFAAGHEREHDDLMDADDYDARRYHRDGWGDARQDRQRF